MAIASDIEVKLKDAKSQRGQFFYLLFDTANGFPDKAEKSLRKGAFSGTSSSFTLKDVPDGHYALTLFHDENTNGKLDTNFIGIPQESFAFSNNPTVIFGPPDFEEAKFEVKGKTKIKLKMKDL